MALSSQPGVARRWQSTFFSVQTIDMRISALREGLVELLSACIAGGVFDHVRVFHDLTERPQDGLADVRIAMYRHIQRLSHGYFERRPTGKILIRFISDFFKPLAVLFTLH